MPLPSARFFRNGATVVRECYSHVAEKSHVICRKLAEPLSDSGGHTNSSRSADALHCNVCLTADVESAARSDPTLEINRNAMSLRHDANAGLGEVERDGQ